MTGTPTSAELYSELDWDARLVTIAGIVDGYLILHMFRETTAGTIDLVGLHMEAMAAPMPRIPTTAELAQYRGDTSVSAPEIEAFLVFAARVRHLAEEFSTERPSRGLTTRMIRLVGGTRMLARARAQLQEVAPRLLFPAEIEKLRTSNGPPRTPDSFYVDLIRRYAELMGEGRGARRRLAAERGVKESTVRGWIDEARRRGMWKTSGPGSPGGIALTEEADDGEH